MNKTKIEWCDYTWNPVTGCYHNCPYCYAERIANRFGTCESCMDDVPDSINEISTKHGTIVELNERLEGETFPYNFVPTFHRYRLNDPQKVKKPSRIFVVSMGDLFGEWVPDHWIQQVFEAGSKAPWHTYIFLTKNPKRYLEIAATMRDIVPPKFFLGATITTVGDYLDVPLGFSFLANNFLSVEPLLDNMNGVNFSGLDWVIIGAQTGPGAVKPKPEWAQSIIEQCREANVPLFLKDNLGWAERIQEYPS